ncbi:hypothetical protein CDL15_Pgr024430 [Punica granatum]|uniref:D-amino-acid transaminase, chloroplastic-like n=1 Tax=Punica granatum TaxID=22663 RepID=A0A218XZG9_PUNGR|nr:hypothetical protein CDL15_Pgr024430 [Punica granatum]
MDSSTRFLFSNGTFLQTYEVPPVSSFLEAHPGAYTTTRTHDNASCVLLWERHLKRLANSVKLLFDSSPKVLFGRSSWSTAHSSLSASIKSPQFELIIRCLVNENMSKVKPVVTKDTNIGHEWAITILISGNAEKLTGTVSLDEEKLSRALDVHIHVGPYIPMVFGTIGARLALAGRGRIIAAAKHSDWVRSRKSLEKLRPPSVNELLLSNDGDHILEGSVTNFFVVCRRVEKSTDVKGSTYSSFEVQTAPLGDGVLPGVIRQLVIEVCLDKGIPVKEVAPSWSIHECWEEAFVTSSLRLLQHVESIRAPSTWDPSESRSWNEIEWEEKQLKGGPGMITTIIQKEVTAKAFAEGYLMTS